MDWLLDCEDVSCSLTGNSEGGRGPLLPLKEELDETDLDERV